MHSPRLSASLVPLLLLLGAASRGEEPVERQRLSIPRVSRAPRLDDFVNGTPREAEAVVMDFIQFLPNDGAPGTQETRAFLSYDDKNLYVGWICKDDPAQIRAHLMRRDDLMNEDRVSISLDTFHDHRRSYWFDVNPYGVQMDGVTVDGVDQINFDTLWYSEARLTDDGYVVLQTIPFKSLRFRSAPVQEWGFVVNRLTVRSNEMTSWPPITPKERGWTSQFGHLDGIERVSQGRNLQFIPYGLFAGARTLDATTPGGPAYERTNDPRFGVDAKAVVKDALTVDLTANPDFSQVESDEPQVTVNQRYEVFFPEKRPFFLENANLFETPTNLFFSRRIADPEVGLRLSGKRDRWAMGLLATDDRSAGQRLPEADWDHGQRAEAAAFRIQREVGRESRVGVFGSTRNFGSGFNRVYSADTRIAITPNWSLVAQWMGSETRAREGSRKTGSAAQAQVQRQGKHFSLSTYYTDRSPDFEAELGYIPRVDMREVGGNAQYWWRPGKGTLVRYGPRLEGIGIWDYDGTLQDWNVEVGAEAELIRQTTFELEHEESYERFEGIGFRKQETRAEVSSDVWRWLAVSGSALSGTNVNYYPAVGLRPFLANWTEANLGLTVRPTAGLALQGSYIFTRLDSREDSTAAGVPSGAHVFSNHIARAKLTYQFTRALSLRTIVDWNGLDGDPALVALEDTKRLGFDVLLTYLLHPGTAVYLGYTDNYENLPLAPVASPVAPRTAFPDTSTGRQVFVKLSYLLRL